MNANLVQAADVLMAGDVLRVAFAGLTLLEAQTGTTDERIAGIRRVIEAKGTVPSSIEDAHLLEMQLGDGWLGPADYRSYIWIKVLTKDVRKWKSALPGAPHDAPIYDKLPFAPKWWLARRKFERMKKYKAFGMFRRHGWIAIDDKGNIYGRHRKIEHDGEQFSRLSCITAALAI